jgi:hypothetical protein
MSEKSYEHFSLVRVYRYHNSVGINASFSIRKRSYKSPDIWSWILQIFANYSYNTTTTIIVLLLPHQLYLPTFANVVAFIWPITTTDNWNVDARNLTTTLFIQHILHTTTYLVAKLIREVPVELSVEISASTICLIFFTFIRSSWIAIFDQSTLE